MSKTIYGVSSGSYSEYSVHFMCTSKEVAERAARELREDDDGYRTDAGVEEFALFDAPPKKVKVYTMQALVREVSVLGAYGRKLAPELYERAEWEWDTDAKKRPSVRVYTAPATGPTDRNVTVFGTSRTAVLKAYSDRIVQMLAPFSGAK